MYNTLDSSIYRDPDAFSANHLSDDSIRIGVVRSVYSLQDKSIRYRVEVNDRNGAVFVECIHMVRFAGVHNFEEFNLRPYLKGDNKSNTGIQPVTTSYDVRSGDVVAVAYLNGDSREGIILGSIGHAARSPKIDNQDIVYRSAFNGVQTDIRKDGTYKVTWNGLPTNTFKLDEPMKDSAKQPPAPEYNDAIAGSFYGFDKSGSFNASDGKKQLIRIQKDKENILIKSGDIRIEIGNSQASGKTGVAIKSKHIGIGAEEVDAKISNYVKIETPKASIKANKVAIGSSSVELLKTLTDLIDQMGKLIVFSPVGPCNPLVGCNEWPIVEKLKSDIVSITGSIVSAAQVTSPEDEDLFEEST